MRQCCGNCISGEKSFNLLWCNLFNKNVKADEGHYCKEWDTADSEILRECLDFEKEDD